MAIESTIPRCGDQDYEGTRHRITESTPALGGRHLVEVSPVVIHFWQAGDRDSLVGEKTIAGKFTRIDYGQPSDILSVQHCLVKNHHIGEALLKVRGV